VEAEICEIAADIFRIAIFDRDAGQGAGLTFCHFLIKADQPLLFHCGSRQMFPTIRAAAERLLPIEDLRWIAFGHLEADECGSMNHWLAAAPRSQVLQGELACMLSTSDMADRTPRAVSDGATVDLGGKQIRYLSTPHVPHGWDAGVIFEESTETLLCGDLFTQSGNSPPLVTTDIVGPALATEDAAGATSLGPQTGETLRRLASLAPKTLALMHGPCYRGDGATALYSLAQGFDRRLNAALNYGLCDRALAS
jgi:flavorubredoxin